MWLEFVSVAFIGADSEQCMIYKLYLLCACSMYLCYGFYCLYSDSDVWDHHPWL